MKKELEEICTQDYMLHDPSAPNFKPGLADFLEGWVQMVGNFKEIRLNIEDMFGVGDKVISRGIFEWTDAKTQEKNKVMAIVISRFENGKLAEEWQVMAPFADSTT
jgi:predicted ester cyclase